MLIQSKYDVWPLLHDLVKPFAIFRIPKISSSGHSTPHRPPSALSQDYENVTPTSSAEFIALRQGKTISTANFVTQKHQLTQHHQQHQLSQQHRSLTPTLSFQGTSRIPTSTTPTLASKIPTRKSWSDDRLLLKNLDQHNLPERAFFNTIFYFNFAPTCIFNLFFELNGEWSLSLATQKHVGPFLQTRVP